MPNKTIRRSSIWAIVFLLISLPAAFANEQSEKENKAIKSAEAFLSLVDSREYEKSWDEASLFFRSQITQKQWSEKLSALRPFFGNTINRSVTHTKYLTSVPGAPDGEYVIVVFHSSFEKKKSASETVTPMLDKNGKWRITGYFIK
jgi:Protein of unknown function (DUF4019)